MMGAVFSDFVASGRGWWSIFRFCGFREEGVVGRVFSNSVASRSGGWSSSRFCGSGFIVNVPTFGGLSARPSSFCGASGASCRMFIMKPLRAF